MQRTTKGWGSGLLGVIIFSGSLPATRVAVGGFTPLFLTSARAVIAALLGAALLLALRQKPPEKRDLAPLTVVAIGVVIGFPLLTALALQHITSARSIVFIGLLPLATAIFGVVRAGERPRPAFWLFSTVGAASVAGFALANSSFAVPAGDLLMVAAIVLCGLGYAEGASLSRRLGGWQVISWALVVALPVMAVIAVATLAGCLDRDRRPGLARAGVCFGLQHACRLRLLVQGTRAWRHRRGWSASIAPALLRPVACGAASRRTGRLVDDRGDRAGRSLRRRRQALCLSDTGPPVRKRWKASCCHTR